MPPSEATTVGMAVPTTVASRAARKEPIVTPMVTAIRRLLESTRRGTSTARSMADGPSSGAASSSATLLMALPFPLDRLNIDGVDRERRTYDALKLGDRRVVVGDRTQLARTGVGELVLTGQHEKSRREACVHTSLLARELYLCRFTSSLRRVDSLARRLNRLKRIADFALHLLLE